MSEHRHDTTVIETIQSLVVAFVLAMTFRGFAVEGFVIPTGSMAPTLLGQHFLLQSSDTGAVFSAGVDMAHQDNRPTAFKSVWDPMLGPEFNNLGRLGEPMPTLRMGDRILVLKCIYPFLMPKRWDVVVFKNPTDPNGDSGNYIKRLIGLPNDSIWLVDGDVFAGAADNSDDLEAYVVQRKPEYIQRAVWQPVSNSDYLPRRPETLSAGWDGAFWYGDAWETETRAFRTESAGPTILQWDSTLRPLTDWAPYNILMQTRSTMQFTSDVRVAATLVPDQDGMTTSLELHARSSIFEFRIDGDQAVVRYRPQDGAADQWTQTDTAKIDALPAGKPTNVEFWHVDQSIKLFVDGDCVASLEYDWRPVERLQHTTGLFDDDDANNLANNLSNTPIPAEIQWNFEGSPVTLHRVRVDRDLYYHQRPIISSDQKPENGRPFTGDWGFATHPSHLGVLGPDHFFMLGDNSTSSLDGRYWGNPAPIVIKQIDDAPFVVHRKLLIGKAWMVYFPSPYPMSEGSSTRVIPDFGRLRFIR